MLKKIAHLNRPRFVLACFLVLLALQVIFLASNVAANMLPHDALVARAEEAWSSPMLSRRYNFEYRIASVPIAYDNNRFISQIAEQQVFDNPLVTAVRANIIDHPASGNPTQFDYFRYWHGWQLLTNVGLLIGGIQAIQAIVFVLLIGSAAWLTYELSRRMGIGAGTAFSLVFFVPTGLIFNFAADLTLGISLSSAVFSSAAILCCARRCSEGSDRDDLRRRACVIALIGGALFNYLDFLTIPAAAVALVVFSGSLALDRPGDATRRRIMTMVLLALSFGAGFLFTWAFKWVLAAAVMGGSYVVENVVNEMSLWTNQSVDLPFPYWPQWQQDLYNFCPQLFTLVVPLYDICSRSPLMAITVGATAALFLFEGARSLIRSRAGNAAPLTWKRILTLAIPALFIPLYAIVMKSHAAYHIPVFSSRIWSAFFAIALGLIVWHMLPVNAMAPDSEDRQTRERSKGNHLPLHARVR